MFIIINDNVCIHENNFSIGQQATITFRLKTKCRKYEVSTAPVFASIASKVLFGQWSHIGILTLHEFRPTARNSTLARELCNTKTFQLLKSCNDEEFRSLDIWKTAKRV
jgi:hypothetical protein